MPVVSQQEVYLTIGTKWKLVIKYSSREGRFFTDLPDSYQGFADCLEVWGNTESEVRGAFWDIDKQYKKAKEVRKKMLYFSFQSTASVMDDEKDKCIFSSEDISFVKGNALSFDWHVIFKVTLKGRVSYVDEDNSNFDVDSRKSLLDWTLEREKFFKSFDQAILSLIMRADKFFNNQPKNKIIDFINRQQKLIGG